MTDFDFYYRSFFVFQGFLMNFNKLLQILYFTMLYGILPTVFGYITKITMSLFLESFNLRLIEI